MRIEKVKAGSGGGGYSVVLRVWPQSDEERRFLKSLNAGEPLDVAIVEVAEK